MPAVIWWILVGILLCGTACYWLLILTEGTYLGPKVVAWLYDLVAVRYDAMKKSQYIYEARHIGIPLTQAMGGRDDWQLLDIASGTGRVPQAVMTAGSERCMIWCVDRSVKMLTVGQRAMTEHRNQIAFSQQEAAQLAFKDKSFEAVACLEALEFMAHPKIILQEMMRVLKPSGILLLSNRTGLDACFFPGRMCGRGRLENELGRMGFVNIRMERWQEHYDLVWAENPSS